VSDLGHASLAVSETLAATLQISMGNLGAFAAGPGHVTAFNPLTGQAVGASMTVGHGPTSLVVLPL
jgi:hypothetical protein